MAQGLRITRLKFMFLNQIQLKASGPDADNAYKGWLLEQFFASVAQQIALLWLPMAMFLTLLLWQSAWAAVGCTRSQCLSFYDMVDYRNIRDWDVRHHDMALS